MSDNAPLTRIKERNREATSGEKQHTLGQAFMVLARSQEDVAPLIAAIEAAANALDNYPIPSKQEDPTGKIYSYLQTLEQSVALAIETALESAK